MQFKVSRESIGIADTYEIKLIFNAFIDVNFAVYWTSLGIVIGFNNWWLSLWLNFIKVLNGKIHENDFGIKNHLIDFIPQRIFANVNFDFFPNISTIQLIRRL